MIGVRVNHDVIGVADRLSELAEVDYVVVTAGEFDLLVEVVCEDDEHLLDVIAGRIRATEGVKDTQTFVYLRLHKQHYNWGTR
jgi:Lrp/AsnC family transcriptional regulator for asnA, asnC and gidA